MLRKLSRLLKAIRLIAIRPALLNNVINDNLVWKKYVEKKYGMGSGLPMVLPDTLFSDFNVSVPVFAFLDGGSLPTDIALLMKFAAGIDNCSYFEIGTWRGESVANVAAVAGDCFTLNLSDDEMRTMGQSEEYIGLTGFFSKNKKNITHLRGHSHHFDFGGLKRKFDLIFIDGDHHYESVKNDTEKVFEHLTHDNSVVVWHDYAQNPESVRYEVLAGILDGLPEAKRRHLFHAANTLSACWVNKRYAAQELSYPIQPEHFFEININLKKTNNIAQ